MHVGFVGLGRMGSAMARNLLRAGHQVTVYNRSRDKAESLAAEGALVAGSAGAACRDAEAVITMLSDDPATEHVVFGDDGIAGGLARGAVHISSSTISVALARRLAAEHANRGQQYLSAPVFGRPEAAEAKKLLVVAAGPSEVIQRCRPLFDAIGRQTFEAGLEQWQANVVKLCGNFMIASMLETFCEAFATLKKSEVQPALFLDVMNALFGSPVYANYGRNIVDRKFEPAGFALKLGHKDVRLALEAAQECASPMPIASLLRDRFLSGVAQGQAEMDWASIAKVVERASGLES